MKRTLAVCLLSLVLALPAAAQGLGGLLGSVQLPIALPGNLTGQLTVSFEDVSGLSTPSLGISLRPISILDLGGLLGRLPIATSLLSSVPLLVRIEPPVQGGLTFHGIATISLQFSELPLLSTLPLRLYAAPLGGAFGDITVESGESEVNNDYRVIGSKGGFSEFLLVLDLTPLHQAAAGKLTRLQQTLNANSAAIAPAVLGVLTAQLAAVQADFQLGDLGSAESDLDLFQATVLEHSGTDIPDVWRATRDVVNVAGLLRAGGDTLSFSLRKLEESGP